jgi:hypothetical protein
MDDAMEVPTILIFLIADEDEEVKKLVDSKI